MENLNFSNSDSNVHDREELTYISHVIIGTILSIACFLGALLNGFALYVIRKTASFRTPTNVFIIALISFDFVLAILAVPMVVVSSFSGRWIFGDLGCVYYGFLTSFAGYFTITMLAVISIDRYIRIVKSHLQHVMTMKTSVFVSVCTMLYGFVWAILPLFGWNRYTLQADKTSCSIHWSGTGPLAKSYTITIAFTCFFLQLGIMVFCYFRIISKIRQSPLMAENTARSRINKNVTTTILIIIIVFLVSWTPYAVVSFYVIFNNSEDIPVAIETAPAIFAKISVIWNPIIYLGRNRDFRKAIGTQFPNLHKICISFTARQEEHNCIQSNEEIEFTEFNAHVPPNEIPFTSNEDKIIDKESSTDNAL